MRQTGQTRCHCGAPLRSDNTSGVCKRHHWRHQYGKAQAARRRRRCEACGRKMRPDCKVARCLACRERDRMPDATRGCELCGTPLRATNRSGRCVAHREKAVRTCACGASIKYDSQACVRCSNAIAWATRRAKATKHCRDCGKPLRGDNTTGLCGVHRTREWKLELRAAKAA